MSKKQNSRKKVNIKIKAHEAYIVGQADWLISLAEMCESLSRKEEYKDRKVELVTSATLIRESVEQTYFDPSIGEIDEDWA
jgi:hypothetical protein